VGVAKFFFSQSIGIDHNNKKIVDVTGFRKLWASQVFAVWSLKWAWQTFLDQPIDIDETNIFQLTFLFPIKTVGVTVLCFVGVTVGVWSVFGR